MRELKRALVVVALGLALVGAAAVSVFALRSQGPESPPNPDPAIEAETSCGPQDPTVDGSGDPCRGIQDGSLLCLKDYQDARDVPAGVLRQSALAEVGRHCSTGTYVP
jgi:hypothetical protein